MSLESIQNNFQNLSEDLRKKILNVLSIEADKSIKSNFAEQGRPAKWIPKRRSDGRSILTGRTGRLQRTINVQVDYNNNRIKIGSNLIYAKVHQEGAIINMPARTLKFRKSPKTGKLQFTKGKSSKTIQTRAYRISIPSRPFLAIPESDFQRIQNSLKGILK